MQNTTQNFKVRIITSKYKDFEVNSKIFRSLIESIIASQGLTGIITKVFVGKRSLLNKGPLPYDDALIIEATANGKTFNRCLANVQGIHCGFDGPLKFSIDDYISFFNAIKVKLEKETNSND